MEKLSEMDRPSGRTYESDAMADLLFFICIAHPELESSRPGPTPLESLFNKVLQKDPLISHQFKLPEGQLVLLLLTRRASRCNANELGSPIQFSKLQKEQACGFKFNSLNSSGKWAGLVRIPISEVCFVSSIT
jgi:hypothetical protein